MKLKTILVCFLAVCAVSLTSCKKENYAEKFVGTYNMSITPSVSIEIMGQQQQIGGNESIDGLKCTIAQVGETQDVTITITDAEMPIVLNATCDETGMVLKSMTISETIQDAEELGEITLDVTVGGATAAVPTNGNITWTSSVTGKIGMNLMGMPIESELSGNVKFNGIKQ